MWYIRPSLSIEEFIKYFEKLYTCLERVYTSYSCDLLSRSTGVPSRAMDGKRLPDMEKWKNSRSANELILQAIVHCWLIGSNLHNNSATSCLCTQKLLEIWLNKFLSSSPLYYLVLYMEINKGLEYLVATHLSMTIARSNNIALTNL